MQGSLGIEQMCQPAQVSRAGFYRSLQEDVPLTDSLVIDVSLRHGICRSRLTANLDVARRNDPISGTCD